MALDKLEEKFWDSLDIFCDFLGDTYWLLLAQAEINEKLRDSPYKFGKFFWDTSRQIFTLSLINDIVCITYILTSGSALTAASDRLLFYFLEIFELRPILAVYASPYFRYVPWEF